MTTDQKVDELSRRLDEVTGYLKETLGFGKDKSRVEFCNNLDSAMANALGAGVSASELASILKEATTPIERHAAFLTSIQP